MKTFLAFMLAALVIVFNPAYAEEAEQKDTIKVGWLYSYTAMPQQLELGRDAALMAVNEFNEAGGLNGHKVELIIRDDRGSAADGVQVVSDLVDREGVDLLAGQSWAVVSKAIYEYAERNNIPYFATWCDAEICEKKEDGYTFSLDQPYTETAHTLAEYAAGLDIKKWAILQNPDTWNWAISKPFMRRLKELRPDVEIVAEVTVPFEEAQGNAISQKLSSAKAEGVLITFFGGDLANYVRTLRQRDMLDKIEHIHAYLPPEEIDFLGEEAPVDWYVAGYPSRELKAPEHIAFIDRFQEIYGKEPGLAGILSYSATLFMLEALKKAGSADAEKIANVASSVSVETPVGLLSMNPQTHVGDFRYWYGKVDLKYGKPVLIDFTRGE